MFYIRNQFISLIKSDIDSKPRVFAEIVNSVFEAKHNSWFRDFLIEEGLGLIVEISPTCPKNEYLDFIARNVGPTSCNLMKIYRFQAKVLN